MKMFKLSRDEMNILLMNGRVDLGDAIIRIGDDGSIVYNMWSKIKWTGHLYERDLLKTYPCKVKII